ncbi:MAG: right-handed parallel beta-helix repeat-containing protein [Deltaproteobacteria bacterium]|nr:right-handed parallel beta-helix repeat-containing protein [Deltaproteobacteria bacterium]
MRLCSPAAAIALLLACACGSEEGTSPPQQTGGQGGVAGSGGDPSVGGGAGTLFEGCQPGTEPFGDGGCLPAGQGAGIAPEQCATGFVPDGASGCEPVLPAQPCAAGTMAIPGETSCREVAPCGTSKWGDVPFLPDTEYVEQGYTGGLNNGDEGTPWTTIGEAVAAAVPNAIVAITDGDYAESLTIHEPLRLWGRCPAAVTISGSHPVIAYAAVEVHDLTVTATSAMDLHSGPNLVDRVRVHNSHEGIYALGPTTISRSLIEGVDQMGVFFSGGGSIEESVIRDTFGHNVHFRDGVVHTACAVRASVIERGTGYGIVDQGADLTIEGSVVRDTEAAPLIANGLGEGLRAQTDPTTFVRPQIVVTSSFFAGNRSDGLSLSGADGIIETTVVRDTRSGADDGLYGRGILVRRNESTLARSDILVRDSLFADNRSVGVFVRGSDLQLESTVVRDTLPADQEPQGGRGIEVQHGLAPAAPSNIAIHGSLIEGNRGVAINAAGATVTLDTSLVRNTMQTAAGLGGRGLSVGDGAVPSATIVRYSVIEDNRDSGIASFKADLEVASTVVRGHRAADNHLMGGMGIIGQSDLDNEQITINVTVRRSLIEDNAGAGIVTLQANLTVEGSLVRENLPFEDDTFGDGVVFSGMHGDVSGSMSGCRIEDNTRAGLAVFGAPMSLGDSSLTCNAVDLNGQDDGTFEFLLTDEGNNRCGCDPYAECKVLSTGLMPPGPVGSL